ncbi:hypothetical protein [Haloarchaeobius sp. DFWS5]|uniref:hypothetical protein n=1 Tax=Haloarchaeobius sp. DFWS5 TaxID=3446114 RepID=UPI003EBBE49D
MTRDETVEQAAIFGLVGAVIIIVGSTIATVLFSSIDTWVSALPSFLIWAGCVYYGMKQFAQGIYRIVEDASVSQK